MSASCPSGPAERGRSASAAGGLVAAGGDVRRDPDFVTDDRAAGLEHLLPAETESLRFSVPRPSSGPCRPTGELGSAAVEAVEVRWSPRARRWRLEVPWDEAPRLTVPEGTSPARVQRLIEEHRRWIEDRRRRQVPRLRLDPSAVSASEARLTARRVVSDLARREAERIGVEYGRIRIGGQRTLWGSCSARGTLSFNWRLVLAPPDVLDYVVVHELCHLRVPNHSRRFWELVERHRPRWREQRDWLRAHGAELMAFRPRA